jgi:hypothetical protein
MEVRWEGRSGASCCLGLTGRSGAPSEQNVALRAGRPRGEHPRHLGAESAVQAVTAAKLLPASAVGACASSRSHGARPRRRRPACRNSANGAAAQGCRRSAWRARTDPTARETARFLAASACLGRAAPRDLHSRHASAQRCFERRRCCWALRAHVQSVTSMYEQLRCSASDLKRRCLLQPAVACRREPVAMSGGASPPPRSRQRCRRVVRAACCHARTNAAATQILETET